MKTKRPTLKLMIMVISCFTIIACKKDDPANTSIVGTWEERHYMYTETDTSVSPPSVYQKDTSYATGQGEILGFGSNDQYTIRHRPPAHTTDTGTYIFSNNTTLTIQFPGQPPGSVHATVTGNDLVITWDFTGGPVKYHAVTNYVRM